MIKSALFNLSVAAALIVATPTFTPTGGDFSDSVDLEIFHMTHRTEMTEHAPTCRAVA